MVERTTVGGTDEAIFRMLYADLRRFASIVSSPDGDADDLVQEAVAAALRRGSLAELDNPGAYLKRSILNLETGHRRRQGRLRARMPRLLADAAVDPSYPSDLSVLAVLSPRDRVVLFLAVVEDLPYAAISEVLGDNEASLRVRVARAKSRLRRALEDGGPR